MISAFVSTVLGACHGNIIQMSLNVKKNNWLTELRRLLVPCRFSQCWIQLFCDSDEKAAFRMGENNSE